MAKGFFKEGVFLNIWLEMNTYDLITKNSISIEIWEEKTEILVACEQNSWKNSQKKAKYN